VADRPKSNAPEIRAAAIDSLAADCLAWGPSFALSDWTRALADVNLNANGFEIAKELDRYSRIYGIDADLVEILDGASSHHWSAHRSAIKAWVAADDVRPTFSVGDRIDTRHGVGRINRIDEEIAVYLFAPDSDAADYGSSGGIHIPYEEATLVAAQVPA
jgi:hypothetical protein